MERIQLLNFEKELGYKCGEVFYLSDERTVIVQCALCEACFEYGNENYLHHVIENHFNISAISRHTKINQSVSKSETMINEQKKENFEAKDSKSDVNVQQNDKKLNLLIAKDQGKDSGSFLKIIKGYSIKKTDTNINKYRKENENCHSEKISKLFNKAKCDVFKKSTSTNLKKQIKDGFICEQCGRIFINKNTLDSHYEIAHNPDRKMYPCYACEKSCKSSDSLMAHIRHFHTKELPYVCEMNNCNKKYASKNGLRYHQGKHSSITYSCVECNKNYSHKNKLQTHFKRLHSVGKIYHCSQCDKSFYHPDFVKKHMICHTNERPFLCDKCPANFPRKKALVAHKKIHLGIKDEICKLCGQAFNLYEGLYQHMKVQHGIKYHRGMALKDMQEEVHLNSEII